MSNSTTPAALVDAASNGFILLSGALVFFMTPGLGVFYSGLARIKNSLSLVMLCFLSIAVVTVQWFIFGFSLAFSESGSQFYGDSHNFVFRNVGAAPFPLAAPFISGLTLGFYELMFAIITVAIIFGATAERIRLLPSILFIFCWTTVVYDVCAYWQWSGHGWLRNLSCLTAPTPCLIGSYDFAGGGPVHIATGFAALAMCIFLGPRKFVHEHKPSSLFNVFLGTGMLWFGWMFFNGGSALGATPRAAVAAFNTILAGSSGGLLWMFMDFFLLRKLSGLSFCTGAVAGLATITPGAGFVAPWASLVFGVVGAFCCFFTARLKNTLHFDDTLDCWGVHGMGGAFGLFLTGIFADSYIISLDGTVAPGGAINGNGDLLGYQMVAIVSIAAWSFVVTYIIAFLINLIPGLKFRSPEEQELYGDDWGEMGELLNHHVDHPDDQDKVPIEKQWGGTGFTVKAEANVGAVPNPRLRKTVKTPLRFSQRGSDRGSDRGSGGHDQDVEMKAP